MTAPPSITVVVLVTMAAQIASAMGIAIFPVIAPHLAQMLGVDAGNWRLIFRYDEETNSASDIDLIDYH